MTKPEAHIRLAIDAMGSDLGPNEVLEGVALAIDRVPSDLEFYFIWEERRFRTNCLI